MMHVRLLLLCLTMAALPARAQDAMSFEALLDAEQLGLKNDCDQASFGDEYARLVNINGDGRDDLILDFGAVVCDGAEGRFCGDGGCLKALFLQNADGSFTGLGRFAAYDVVFDRPNALWPSFEVNVAPRDCNLTAFEPCVRRYEIRNGQLRLLTQ